MSLLSKVISKGVQSEGFGGTVYRSVTPEEDEY